MVQHRVLIGLASLAIALLALSTGAPARAANSPTFRDCSLVGGLDPDFVQISGVSVGPDSTLTVFPSQNKITLRASESSDPGDSAGHVTLTVTIASPGQAVQTISGAGIGQVLLSLPLNGSGVGRTYTISWSATFDNGNHACPSNGTPANTPTDPHPFVVTVANPSSV